jgi:ATP-binding cassette subfamily B protein
MELGKVVDFAPHSVLLQRCAIYQQLWQQQNRHIKGPHAIDGPVLVSS